MRGNTGQNNNNYYFLMSCLTAGILVATIALSFISTVASIMLFIVGLSAIASCAQYQRHEPHYHTNNSWGRLFYNRTTTLPIFSHNSHAHNGHVHNSHAHNGHVHNSHAHNGHVHNSHAHNSHAHNSHAHNSHAHNGHAHNSHVHNTHVHNAHVHNAHR